MLRSVKLLAKLWMVSQIKIGIDILNILMEIDILMCKNGCTNGLSMFNFTTKCLRGYRNHTRIIYSAKLTHFIRLYNPSIHKPITLRQITISKSYIRLKNLTLQIDCNGTNNINFVSLCRADPSYIK